MKAFQTWTKRWEDGTTSRFLAIPCSAGVFIMDDEGHNFGSWMSIDSFVKRQKRGLQVHSLSGRVELTIKLHEEC